MDELLALLGQHWRLLLVFPSGLSAVGAVAFDGWSTGSLARWRHDPKSPLELVILAAWLLALALLPLPRTSWPYSPDLVSLLLLLEVPFWAVVLRKDGAPQGMMAAALNVYPLLALAIAGLGLDAGSLVLRDLNRSTGVLHWISIALWSAALPPLLALGPWHAKGTSTMLASSRRVGHQALLLAASLPAHESTPWWTVPVGYALVVFPLALLDRRWRGSPERWIAWQAVVSIGGLVLLAMISGMRLIARLG